MASLSQQQYHHPTQKSSSNAPSTTTTTPIKFIQRLCESRTLLDLQRLQQDMTREVQINSDPYCSHMFNHLIRASAAVHHANHQTAVLPSFMSELPRHILKEILFMQMLTIPQPLTTTNNENANGNSLNASNMLVMSPSLLLYCFMSLLEPTSTTTTTATTTTTSAANAHKLADVKKRIKVLCLLLVQNHYQQAYNKKNNKSHHSAGQSSSSSDEVENDGTVSSPSSSSTTTLPSILEEYFMKPDLVEILKTDVEMCPIVFRLLELFARSDTELVYKHLEKTIIEPFVLKASFQMDNAIIASSATHHAEPTLSETHLYILTCIIPFLMNMIDTRPEIAQRFLSMVGNIETAIHGSHNIITGMERVFVSWLLRAGTSYQNIEKKKTAVFRGGGSSMAGSVISVTELDGSPCSGFFTVLNYGQTFTRRQVVNTHLFSTLHSWIRAVYYEQLNQNQPQFMIGSPNNMLSSSVPDTMPMPEDAISQRQYAPMDNPLLEASVQYCLRLLQQAELKYNNNNNPKIMFSSSYIESALVEAVGQLDDICSLYPVMVGKVFPNLKKLFHVLCNYRTQLNQNLAQQQTSSQTTTAHHHQLQQQSAMLSQYRRKYQAARILGPTAARIPNPSNKQLPSSEQLLQSYIMNRSNIGSLLIAIMSFFIHHIHTLVYDPQSLFQIFFGEQFPYYYREPLFPIEVMILFLENQKIIHHETRLLDDHYPQLFKLVAYRPYQTVQEFKIILPSLISSTNFLDVLHRILDLPLLSFVLDCDHRRQSIHSSAVLGTLLDSVVSDRVNSLHDFWSKHPISSSEWDQFIMNNSNTNLPDAVDCCVAELLETYFDIIISEQNQTCLQELLPMILNRVNTLFSIGSNREAYQRETRKILLKYFMNILKRWPSFIIDMKQLLLQTLQDPRGGDIFVHVCYSIGECLSTCTDDRFSTQLIVQYFEVLELVTFEHLAKARMQSKMKNKGISDPLDPVMADLVYSELGLTQSLNTLISSMCKASARCLDLVPRVVVCLANLIKHSDCLHPSVIQRANESTRLLRFPSIVTSLLCASSSSTIVDDEDNGLSQMKPSQININGDNQLFRLI